jgi:hypothetical protein
MEGRTAQAMKATGKGIAKAGGNSEYHVGSIPNFYSKKNNMS